MRTVVICVGCNVRQVILEDDWYLIRDTLEEHGWHGRAGQWCCPACDENGVDPGQPAIRKLCHHCHEKPVPSNLHHYCSEECRLAAQEERARRRAVVS